jgi:hypothetical protein
MRMDKSKHYNLLHNTIFIIWAYSQFKEPLQCNYYVFHII